MPSPTTTKLPRPKSWDEFEDICSDVLQRKWQDAYVARNGRGGQHQSGVDIYGRPLHLGSGPNSPYAGAQCKNTDELTLRSIKEEVEKALKFRPELREYLILTTVGRDAHLQEAIRLENWPFRVEVLFWEDISLLLSGHADLLKKHFPAWVTETTSINDVFAKLARSSPSDFVYSDVDGLYTHASDIKFKIVLERKEHNTENFSEPWVKRFPDPNAHKMNVNVEYDGTCLARRIFVSVDGHRYLLPLPKASTDLRVSKADYDLGRILAEPHSTGYSFIEGLRIAGIIVDESLPDFTDVLG